MLEFYVTKGQELKRRDQDVVSADTTDLKAQFDLTSDFTGTITVWWRRSDKPGSTWTSTLSGNQCTIPAEALSAATDNVMYGEYDHFVFVSISDTGRTTSSECEIKVNKSAFSTNSTPGTGGSPTAYEELVEQFDELKADNQTFKDNMTEQQETFESTVTENVNNIRYVVETETAPPIIEEASGAEITLDDSAYRQVRDLKLYGYSKQVQTTGAQLLDYSTLSGAQNGITPSIDDDNYIVLNGTATANAFIYVLCNIPSGTSMFISVNNPVLNNNISVYIRDEESTYSSEYIALDTANKTHAFASASVAISRFAIRVVQGTTLTNFRLRPMLNSGTSALPWEPYSGGYASPSPDWAQPIHSVADEVNLLNFPDVESVVVDGVTWSCKDGVVSATGNATGQANTIYSDLSYIFPIKSGTYKISGANDKILIIARITKSDDSMIYPADGFTLDGTEKEVRIYVRVPKTGAISSTIYPMLNRGSSALPYRPYGHNVTVESAGANLLNFPDVESVVVDGVTWSCKDGVVSATGNATGQANTIYSDLSYIFPIKSGTYKISGANDKILIIARITKSDDSMIYPADGFTLDGTEKEVRIYVRIPKTGAISSTIYPMLNAGTSALPWQPYAAPSSALIALTDSLRGIPVTSGGTYTDDSGQQWIADYIYRRQTDGKWRLWRNCGRVEYIGGDDENWTYEGAYFRFTTSSGVSNALVVDGRSMVICNRGLYHQSGFGTGYAFIAGGPRFYYSPDSGMDSVDGFKTWLQSNPLEVVYQLATPTVEELPTDVQTELNGLMTYNLHTDMWNNDGAFMNLKYVADTKTWINKKIAGISTAMIENL